MFPFPIFFYTIQYSLIWMFYIKLYLYLTSRNPARADVFDSLQWQYVYLKVKRSFHLC